MSHRTPGLQPRSQYHSYWGQYAWNAGGVAPGSANLPNGTLNPLGLPYVGVGGQLELGDTASTTDPSDVNIGLWVCIDPGTASGGDAVWARCDNGAPTVQTIRDAHVIVVGQFGRLTTLFGATPPPTNQLNLVAISGDADGITCDFIDLGDGAQLALALLAAAAAGVGVDVRVRACSILMNQVGSPVLPLTIPDNCRLTGAGRAISLISGDNRNAKTQEMFILGLRSELDNFSINSPATTEGNVPAVGASMAVIRTNSSFARIYDCALLLGGSARTQPWMIWDASGTIDVHDTNFDGVSQTDPTSHSTCLVVGNPITPNSFTVPAAGSEWVMDNCRGEGWNRVVFSYNCAGGCVDNAEFAVVRPTSGAFETLFGGAPVTPPPVLANRLNNIRLVVANTEGAADVAYFGVRIRVVADGVVVSDFTWSSIQVLFVTPVAFTKQRIAFDLIVLIDNGVIEGGSMQGCSSIGHSTGCRMFTDAPVKPGTVSDVMLTNCLLKNPTAMGADPGNGVLLEAQNKGAVQNIGIMNCNARNAPAAGFGINIATAGVLDTIVVANQLAAAGGTALQDLGTTTEPGHNIS